MTLIIIMTMTVTKTMTMTVTMIRRRRRTTVLAAAAAVVIVVGSTSGIVAATHFRAASRSRVPAELAFSLLSHIDKTSSSRVSPPLTVHSFLLFSFFRYLSPGLFPSSSCSICISLLSLFCSLFVPRTDIRVSDRILSLSPPTSLSLSLARAPTRSRSFFLLPPLYLYLTVSLLERALLVHTPYCHAGIGYTRYCQSRPLPAIQVHPFDLNRIFQVYEWSSYALICH